jgi:hypothetical protein
MKSIEGDMAKQLEKNEQHQEESISEKPEIEKLRLTADDLPQYGRLRQRQMFTEDNSWLSWLSLTCSFMPRILITYYTTFANFL